MNNIIAKLLLKKQLNLAGGFFFNPRDSFRDADWVEEEIKYMQQNTDNCQTMEHLEE